MARGLYTGYIHALIDEGQTPEEFIWNFARQYGFLIHLRDEPNGPITAPPVPDTEPFRKGVEQVKAHQAVLLKGDCEETRELYRQMCEKALATRDEDINAATHELEVLQATLRKLEELPADNTVVLEAKQALGGAIPQATRDLQLARDYDAVPPSFSVWLTEQLQNARLEIDSYWKSLDSETRRWRERIDRFNELAAIVPVPNKASQVNPCGRLA